MILRDGAFVDIAPTVLPMQAAYGAFTTFGCARGKPLLWERHCDRLARTLRYLAPEVPFEMPQSDIVIELLRFNDLSAWARGRHVVFRDEQSKVWRAETSVSRITDAGPGRAPLDLAVRQWSAAPPLAGHKTLSRLAWDHARECAVRTGADDVLLVDGRGCLLETSIANIFAVVGGRVITPPAQDRCLPGIMRAWVMEHCEKFNLEVVEDDIHVNQIDLVEEMWVTNAVVGVRRVAAVGTMQWGRWPVYDRLFLTGVPAPGWQYTG